MDVFTISAQAGPAARAERSPTVEEPGADTEFARLLQRFDASQETAGQRLARQRKQAEEARAQKEQMRQRLALQAQIAQLRSRMANGTGTMADQAELGMLQTQLFWLAVG